MTKLHDTVTTAGAAIADALQTLAGLRDEVREAYDNTPESLQSGDVGQAREAAADALDSFCDESPDEDLHEEALGAPATYGSNRRRRQSRSDRRDEAVRMLDAAASALEHWAEEADKEDDEDHMTKYDEDEVQAVRDEAERVRGWIDEADGVEFPGRN